ncbi:ROK family protein [Cryobacterium sp. TMT1-62]|uniref:ROK family transcriptional regulator n=1 Tax=unclassified Cryobacterium TaxID=2649013 RepID=UPI000CE4F4E7|nr:MULTISPECIES: ROK family protein [unclassified Cryobacterium]TFB60668.1 ROK family protein [Cryobacterium sp. Hz7]TFC49010.1 ROK family protein [Cryobacterium sp. TMT2-17-1]TFD36347.1 ROK family protein [Cryobacterium sp. TMT1-62]
MAEIQIKFNGFSAAALFQLLRDGQPRTKAELVTMTGLARSTIQLRIDTLLDLGLIAPVNDAVSTGGRPSAQVALNPKARVIAAVDFGATQASLALTDLAGEILGRTSSKIIIADGPETCLGWMVRTIRSELASLRLKEADLIAIGIGLPGPVEHSTGRPSNPPIMPGWDDFDVPGFVNHHLTATVLVDNDVNIMALGEQKFAWPDMENIIFLKASTGIGSGIISSGVLQRGAEGIAGDIGHVQIARGQNVPCRCGNSGCLEAMAAGPALAQRLALAGVEYNGKSIAVLSDVVAATKAGELAAIQAVRQAGRDIGEVLTTCVSVLNPSIISIGGSLAFAGDHLLAGVREVVYSRTMPLATEHLIVAQSRAGADAGIIGASVMAIDFALSSASIDAMAAALESANK